MAKDHRLESLNRYIRDDAFVKQKKLDFGNLFQQSASSGQAPFSVSRFSEQDLLKKLMTRKLSLNPGLNFVGDSPDQYEVFAGLPNFNRAEYSFNEGRPLTPQRPEEQPGYNSLWVDAYRLSPTIPPDKKVKSTMPSAFNPDPRGYVMAAAVSEVDNEEEGKTSVAELLAKGSAGAPLSSVSKEDADKNSDESSGKIEESKKA